MAMDLIKANIQKNSGKIDEVITDLTNIRWGFQKAIEIQSGVTTLDEVMKEQELQNGANTHAPQNGDENNAG